VPNGVAVHCNWMQLHIGIEAIYTRLQAKTLALKSAARSIERLTFARINYPFFIF
jgi:hypothetical protein